MTLGRSLRGKMLRFNERQTPASPWLSGAKPKDCGLHMGVGEVGPSATSGRPFPSDYKTKVSRMRSQGHLGRAAVDSLSNQTLLLLFTCTKGLKGNCKGQPTLDGFVCAADNLCHANARGIGYSTGSTRRSNTSGEKAQARGSKSGGQGWKSEREQEAIVSVWL